MALEIFVDSSAWLPLTSPTDLDHPAFAAELRAQLSRGARPVTTNLVIAETHALLLRRANRRVATTFLRQVRRPTMVIATSDADLEARAEQQWIDRYEDHDFSLTDAVSFTVMADRGIRHVFTLDNHFATAGFTLVP